MKTKQLFILSTAIAILAFSSCETSVFYVSGSGNIITETLELEEFNKINMLGAEDVEIFYGAQQKVEVRGDDNIIPRIKTKVVNGTWDIELERGNYNRYELKYYITLPRINKIANDGAARVTINDFENQGSLEILIDGAGDIELNRMENTEELYVSVNGVGKVVLTDEFPALDYMDIFFSGAGEFSGYPAMARECRIEINGTAKCEVSVEEFLDVIIDGAGSVKYKGNPSVSQEVSGLGVVKSID